jgi:hypothetical protein
MKDRVLPDGIVSPFKMKPKIAIIFGFALLFLLLLGDYLSPNDYRLVSLYILSFSITSQSLLLKLILRISSFDFHLLY